MAETDLTPEEAGADDRLPRYNVGDYDPATNEFGFDNDGHQVNQMRQARDAGIMGRLARRLALFTQGLANTVAANVLLTAEDAENTRLDRIATAENVAKAAGQVTLASGQANRSRDEADRAAGFAAGVNLPGIGPSDALKFLRAKADGSGYENAPVDLYSAALVQRVARSSNTQIVKADKGKLFVLTGSFTQTVVSPADLGDGHHYLVKNAGTGNITIPASDGRTNWIMYPGEMRLFQCDGTTLRSEVLWPFLKTWTVSGEFVEPPGYGGFMYSVVYGGDGGAAGQTRTSSNDSPSGGAGGSPGLRFLTQFPVTATGQTRAVTVGGGGVGGVGNVGPSAGGVSSVEGIFASESSSYRGGAGGGGAAVSGTAAITPGAVGAKGSLDALDISVASNAGAARGGNGGVGARGQGGGGGGGSSGSEDASGNGGNGGDGGVGAGGGGGGARKTHPGTSGSGGNGGRGGRGEVIAWGVI